MNCEFLPIKRREMPYIRRKIPINRSLIPEALTRLRENGFAAGTKAHRSPRAYSSSSRHGQERGPGSSRWRRSARARRLADQFDSWMISAEERDSS